MSETSPYSVRINGIDVPITTSSRQIAIAPDAEFLPGQIRLSTIVESPLLQRWAASIKPGYTVTKVIVKAVTMFGTRVGFLFIEADITDLEGRKLPGAVFLRGDSVAMLVELRTPTNRYALLVRQARTPAGGAIYELPAGMLDDSGDFKGVAFRELEEELPALKGKFTVEHVSNLCREPIWISPGGCDERMDFYYLQLKLTEEDIAALHGTVGGLKEEGEHLQAAVVPWDELLHVPDGKLQIALALLAARQLPEGSHAPILRPRTNARRD